MSSTEQPTTAKAAQQRHAEIEGVMHDEQRHRLPGDRDPADQHQPAQADPVEGRPAARAVRSGRRCSRGDLPVPSFLRNAVRSTGPMPPLCPACPACAGMTVCGAHDARHQRCPVAVHWPHSTGRSPLADPPAMRHIGAMPEPVIQVDQSRQALWHAPSRSTAIGFHVERGVTAALLGGNGAGKTTTLSILLGPLLPTSRRGPCASARTCCGIATGCCRGSISPRPMSTCRTG